VVPDSTPVPRQRRWHRADPDGVVRSWQRVGGTVGRDENAGTAGPGGRRRPARNPSDHDARSISLQRYAKTSRPRVRATSLSSVARMALRPHHQWCHAVVSRPRAVDIAVTARTGAASSKAMRGPALSPTPGPRPCQAATRRRHHFVHRPPPAGRERWRASIDPYPCERASAQTGRRSRVDDTGAAVRFLDSSGPRPRRRGGGERSALLRARVCEGAEHAVRQVRFTSQA
jgi:hypothetical protein